MIMMKRVHSQTEMKHVGKVGFHLADKVIAGNASGSQ